MTATRLMPNTQDRVARKSISQMADDQVSVLSRCRSLLTCPFWPLQGLAVHNFHWVENWIFLNAWYIDIYIYILSVSSTKNDKQPARILGAIHRTPVLAAYRGLILTFSHLVGMPISFQESDSCIQPCL